jgi:hypothetical protein
VTEPRSYYDAEAPVYDGPLVDVAGGTGIVSS